MEREGERGREGNKADCLTCKPPMLNIRAMRGYMLRGIHPFAANPINGTAKTTPRLRPHMRWNHSMK